MTRGLLRVCAPGLALLLACSVEAQQPRLAEWVQSNPFNEQDKIALGYPPPIPVHSPLPFDGFRSYDALHVRHQDLATLTNWVHPHELGRTRNGRTIWAYRLGDEDQLTPWGLPEPATLTNGGIHAREWQSPEVVTGILELIATAPPDRHLYDYLREQVNMLVIPVLNVDGFLQTQRYPTLNYLGSDPGEPDTWPRDGRMRRKNMLGVDEDLGSVNDHLRGVDLNRNNEPFWATGNSGNSSGDVRSLVHHGAAPASEPETRALDQAAQLGPAGQLRLYTDVHSYSQVHFWARSENDSLALQTQTVLDLFTRHHGAFPAGKRYAFSDRFSLPRNRGIGSTDEYFTYQYGVPAWTLEIEPSGGQQVHAPLPGGGADYGGDGVNGHDGFILPEAEIRRVREQLAQSFATVFYRQAGPPHLQVLRIIDDETGAVVFETAWDRVTDDQRNRFELALRSLELGRDYRLWAGFNKPMRWIKNGQATALPGQPGSTTSAAVEFRVGEALLDAQLGDIEFLLQPGGAPDGYLLYASDALSLPLRLLDNEGNRSLLASGEPVAIGLRTLDMTGTLGLDSAPETVVRWQDGWQGYEGADGRRSEFGGWDRGTRVPASGAPQAAPFTLVPGMSAAWYDPDRISEGFIIEMLTQQQVALYWFTYDDQGRQNWYLGLGQVRGNRLVFPRLLQTSGGRFRPGDNAPELVEDVVGSASFIFTGCDRGHMQWQVGNRSGRQQLQRLTRVMGLDCGMPMGAPQHGPVRPRMDAPISEDALLSGAWFDPQRPGQGLALEVLKNGSAAVYWFSYDRAGALRWYFGVGQKVNGVWEFPDMLTSSGGLFGDAHAQGQPELQPWGSLSLELGLDGGSARYRSTEDGYGVGRLNLVRLTRLYEASTAEANAAAAKNR